MDAPPTSAPLPFADLLRLLVVDRETARVVVSDHEREGELYIANGNFVHASFGDLLGNDAVLAMLAAPSCKAEVEPGRITSRRTAMADPHSLLADESLDEIGPTSLDEIGPTSLDESDPASLDESDPASLDEFDPTSLDEHDPAPLPAPGPWRSNMFGVLALVLAMGIAVALVWAAQIVRRNGENAADTEPASASAAPTSDLIVLEANDLTGPDDAAPKLVDGPPVLAPRTTALSPNVVVRMRIDAAGKVAEAKIYRSRTELADFEQAALAAVERYRFVPARKQGAPVSAWINLPVSFTTGDPRGRRLIRIKGSDTIGGELGPALGRTFGERNQRVIIDVEAHGSSTGFEALIGGTAEIAASSRSIGEAELASAASRGIELREYVIGYDGIAVVVHPDNPIGELDTTQLAAVFSGEISSWSALGGEGEIMVLSRSATSGTHGFFLDKVIRADGRSEAELLGRDRPPREFAANTKYVESSRELVDLVASEPRAIGYIGVAWVGDSVKQLALAKPGEEPVQPTADAISSGRYPIYRPLLLYARAQPGADVASLLRFVLGSQGQSIIAAHGFVAVGPQGEEELPRLEDAGVGAPALYVTQVHFGDAQTELQDEQRLALRKLIDAGGESRLVLVGSDATDHARGKARAEQVRHYLVSEGVTSARVELREIPVLGVAGPRVDIYVGL